MSLRIGNPLQVRLILDGGIDQHTAASWMQHLESRYSATRRAGVPNPKRITLDLRGALLHGITDSVMDRHVTAVTIHEQYTKNEEVPQTIIVFTCHRKVKNVHSDLTEAQQAEAQAVMRHILRAYCDEKYGVINNDKVFAAVCINPQKSV